MEASFEIADEELSTVRDMFGRELHAQPVGFHVPFIRYSAGTVRAAKRRGIEWIAGCHPDYETSLMSLTPQSLYDLQLFKRGLSRPSYREAGSTGGARDTAALSSEYPRRSRLDRALRGLARPSLVQNTEYRRQRKRGVVGAPLDCFPPFTVVAEPNWRLDS